MMKPRNLLRSTAVSLCLVLGLLFGTVGMSAYGLEVPKDVQEVHIPVTLPADTPIAGGEVEFSQSSGLTYLRFEPAGGIHNPVRATVEDKTYVGFFSADNEYQPIAGNLLMGDLVFSYTGDATEQVTLSKIKLHTKVSTDSGVSVDTEVVNPGTIIPVSRPNGGGSGGGGNEDSGGGGGSGNGGNSGNTSNSGNTGNTGGLSNTGTGGIAGTGAGGAVVDAANTPSGTTGTGSSSGSRDVGAGDNGGTAIENSTTPLAGPIANNLDEQTLPLWLIWFLAAFIFVMLVLFMLVWLKRRQQEAQATEENFGTHMRGDGDTDHGVNDSANQTTD
jgi:hypothetical protein